MWKRRKVESELSRIQALTSKVQTVQKKIKRLNAAELEDSGETVDGSPTAGGSGRAKSMFGKRDKNISVVGDHTVISSGKRGGDSMR